MGKSLEVDVFVRLAQAYRPFCPGLRSGNSAMDLEEVTLFYLFSGACPARSWLEKSLGRVGWRQIGPLCLAQPILNCVWQVHGTHSAHLTFAGLPASILAAFSIRRGSVKVKNQESLGVPPASDLKGYRRRLYPCSQLASEGPSGCRVSSLSTLF